MSAKVTNNFDLKKLFVKLNKELFKKSYSIIITYLNKSVEYAPKDQQTLISSALAYGVQFQIKNESIIFSINFPVPYAEYQHNYNLRHFGKPPKSISLIGTKIRKKRLSELEKKLGNLKKGFYLNKEQNAIKFNPDSESGKNRIKSAEKNLQRIKGVVDLHRQKYGFGYNYLLKKGDLENKYPVKWTDLAYNDIFGSGGFEEYLQNITINFFKEESR